MAAASVALASLTASCGGGGGAPTQQAAPLTIVAAPLAAGDTRFAYDQSISAAGGSGDYRFTVAGGTIPPGLSLGPDGALRGTPTADGTFAFYVEAEDAADPSATATRLFSVPVGLLTVELTTPHWGEAWAGDVCTIESTNEASIVSYEILHNASHGSIVPPAGPGHAATYVAGPTVGRDLVRCTRSDGVFVDVPIEVSPVLPDPFLNMTARFGSTDVWYLDFGLHLDPANALPTDFDAALAAVGLRGPFASREVWQLAREAVIHETLRQLNLVFLNKADGSAAAGGIAISFPYGEPQAPYASPSLPGGGPTSVPAVPGLFNRLGVHGVPFAYHLDTPWFQDWCPPEGNPNVDNLMPGASGSLALCGMSTKGLASCFNRNYANSMLIYDPVGPDDADALRAVLYGRPVPPGARAYEVVRVVEDFAALTAASAAGEIYINVAFHKSEYATPDQQFGDWTVWPTSDAMPTWNDHQITLMREFLPGPGR